MKLFISYARVDRPLCEQIAYELQSAHEVWYDARLHGGEKWKDEIDTYLEWCDGFVYLLSPESVSSEQCQREFGLVRDTGKRIFPVLIQARTEIPEWLQEYHYIDLSQSIADISKLLSALTVAERKLQAPATLRNVAPTEDTPPDAALRDALDAMDAKQFDKAVFLLERALTQKPEEWLERLLQQTLQEAKVARRYTIIAALVERAVTRKLGCEEFAAFHQEFPDYDPENLAARCLPRVPELLPPPFAWVEIPAGQVMLVPDEYDQKHSYLKRKTAFDVAAFAIAKYPITNAQYAQFVEAGGYRERRWWTKAGWTEPRHWQNPKWNGADHPVVGVSWYEALAFCRWLSEVSGEEVTLPTEQQWQRAAQGDDGRVYPWGDEWDGSRCNTQEQGPDHTTPVRQYEGHGDSPFGVVDMTGNVWEWCLTAYETGKNTLEGIAVRVLRGGSWNDGQLNARAAVRDWVTPFRRFFAVGFRVVRPPSP